MPNFSRNSFPSKPPATPVAPFFKFLTPLSTSSSLSVIIPKKALVNKGMKIKIEQSQIFVIQ
ncbi:hypothetical protein AFK68_28240 [Hydrocoleum sp. CS-953]|nr:hypothetical protein AFK68_28240 [Hydrocoleum sp. CS-953]